jgi:cytochrome b561
MAPKAVNDVFPLFSRILHWLMAAMILAMLLINRLVQPPPPLPQAMPGWQRFIAHASHFVLYGLIFALPLVGWGMLSAGGYPIDLVGSFHLPAILPHSSTLYAVLRPAHTVLAYLLFVTFLVHLGAALAHAFIFRDGVFESMTH